MRIIVVAQNKGGDGKSTLSRLLAEHFARKKLRVLAVDLDPQCNLSQRFLTMDHDPTDPDGVMPPVHPDYDPNDPDMADWDGRSSIADIFRARPVFPYQTNIAGLDMLPGYGVQLREVEMVTKEEVKQRVHNRIEEFLLVEEVQDAYDIVIIDTSPSKGPLNRGALRAATHMVIPCQMEQQSIEGLQGMLQLVRQENRLRAIDNPLRLVGVVANKFRKGVSIQEGIKLNLERDPVISPHLIPHLLGLRSAFSEADHPAARPKSIFDLADNNLARIEAEAVCKYIDEAVFHED